MDIGTRKARGQPHLRHKTQPAERSTLVDQVPKTVRGHPQGGTQFR